MTTPTVWNRVSKMDEDAVAVVDGKGPKGNGVPHYSRRKPGAWQFMPPGQTIVLLSDDCDAVWGWWRPHPDSGIKAMNGLDGWTCTLWLWSEWDVDLRLPQESAQPQPRVLLQVRRLEQDWAERRSTQGPAAEALRHGGSAGMRRLVRALQASWPERRPDGQCAITALVVQDFLGGEILRAIVPGRGSHYWNLIPGMGEVDLTRSQFPQDEPLPRGEVVPRSGLLEGERAIAAKTLQRYRALLADVIENLA